MSEKASTSAGSAATSSDPAAAYRPAGTSLMADTRAIATAEPWLTALAGAPRPPRSKAREAIGELDTDHALPLAVAYLSGDAPEAPEGEAGEFHPYRIPDRAHHYGLSEPMAPAMTHETWTGTPTHPPRDTGTPA